MNNEIIVNRTIYNVPLTTQITISTCEYLYKYQHSYLKESPNVTTVAVIKFQHIKMIYDTWPNISIYKISNLGHAHA